MAAKYDGVIEAVRYAQDGKIALVRIYERRGPTWSDRVLLNREQFIEQLKTKKKFMIGQRVDMLGGTFDVSSAIRLSGKGDQALIQSGNSKADCDCLDGAPLF